MTAVKNNNKKRKEGYQNYRANGTREANRRRRAEKEARRASPCPRCGYPKRLHNAAGCGAKPIFDRKHSS